jgi:hypothetical protein
MRFFWCVLGLMLGCSPVSMTSTCGPNTCAGCCSANGRCEVGVSANACGQAGQACQACTGCNEGLCPGAGGVSGTGGAPSTGGSGAGGSSATGGSGAGGSSATGGSGALDLNSPLTPGAPGTADVAVTVRTDGMRRTISPLIYGTNQADNPARNRYGMVRLGGNRLTAYNWENNASNAGEDFMNQNDGYLSTSNVPGAALQATVMAAQQGGGAALLTIPIIDWVAADKNGNGDVNQAPNFLNTRFKQNRATKGAALSLTPDTADGFVNQDEFVNWVRTNITQVPVLFSLDNEPDLWSITHPRVHPMKVGYVELVERNVRFATMVKTVWPQVHVTGFVSYGFSGYLDLQEAPDAAGKGEFLDYYLAQMQLASQRAGRRLVDSLDLHWYPEATGAGTRIIETGTGAAIVAARVQAPRSLWDSSYQETSWIRDYYQGALRLIPRLQEKIAQRWSGTELVFTEWNYGGGAHISGAVASADVLGIFGQQGVYAASLWKLSQSEPFSDAAIEAFRNFDGQGGAFGDTSISAQSANVATVTAYASVDQATPGRTVIVLINKATQARTVGLTLAHPQRYQQLRTFTLQGTTPRVVAGNTVMPAAVNAWVVPLPAMSVTVVVPSL